MTSTVETDTSLQTADQIEAYLRNNPSFFLGREQLLAELSLPHESGGAVSLLERQVSLLRERNIESRKRLNQFVSTAKNNDELFDKTQHIILSMLEAKSLTELINNFTQYALDSFCIDNVSITLLNDKYPITEGLNRLSFDMAIKQLPWLTSIKGCISGHFRDEELKALFPKASPPASAIVLPLYDKEELLALTCFGSKDSHYFNPSMDTLFIEFIAAVLSRCITRFKNQR